MYKENGRHKPAEEKETANVKTKKMKCSVCGTYGYFNGVRFGEKKKCMANINCNGVMEEEL